jgi:hypothetical protein
MNIIEILLLGFLGTLILIFGFLAYEIWSILQIYHTITDVASIKNLKKIQRVALWVVKWWKNRKSETVTALLLATIFVSCHGGTVPKSPANNDLVPEKPDPESVYTRDGDETWWYARFYIIDSCEYVHIDECWVHKGNCKFCKKRRDEEINRIINALCARP